MKTLHEAIKWFRQSLRKHNIFNVISGGDENTQILLFYLDDDDDESEIAKIIVTIIKKGDKKLNDKAWEKEVKKRGEFGFDKR